MYPLAMYTVEDMPVQKVNNFLVITFSSHGGYGCNIGLKMAKNKEKWPNFDQYGTKMEVCQ